MSAPLHFEKDGLRLTVCSQERAVYLAVGHSNGSMAVLLSPAEVAEVAALLIAFAEERRGRPFPQHGASQ